MAESQSPLHLKCELSFIKLTNLGNVGSPGACFIRCYISAGSGRRIRIDTDRIPSKDGPTVERHGPPSQIRELLEGHSVTFELRRRKERPVIGRVAGSELLGRAEIAWRDVWGSSADVPVEKQVGLDATYRLPDGVEPPRLVVRMAVRVSKAVENGRVWPKGGVGEGCDCGDSRRSLVAQ